MSRAFLVSLVFVVACSDGSRGGDAEGELERPPLRTRDVDAGTATAVTSGEIACGKVRTSRVADYRVEGPFFAKAPGPTPYVLASGRVFAAAWTYDPSTDVWSEVPQLLTSGNRFGSCGWLRDDSVMCVGGQTCGAKCSQTPSNRAYVLDARMGTWTAIAAMHEGRSGAPVLRLSDGRIVVIGNGAEIYDRATNAWTEYPDVAATTGYGITATLLDADRVLVTGGASSSGDAIANAELFDARTGERTVVAPMSIGRTDHSAVRLHDGRILVVGGRRSFDGASLSAAEVLDPATGAWSTTAPLPHAMYGVGLVATSCGGAVAIGGVAEPDRAYAEAWTWDAATNTWSLATRLQRPRGHSGLAVLEDQTVLVVSGGVSIESLASAERLFVE